MVVTLASLLLSACGETSSSTVIDTTPKEDWSEDIKSQMLDYCGEILPYPQGMLSGDITCELAYDGNNMEVFQISDASSSFTLADWYVDLELSDWYVIEDYNGNVLQPNSSTEDSYYVEVTKKGATGLGLDVSYFFDEGREATEHSDAVPSGNVIWLYNSFTAEASKNASWTEDESSTIKSTLTETLPMLPLGEDYTVYQRSDDVLVIYDEYITDNRVKAEKALKNNGFDFESDLSKSYNCSVLSKTLEDGSYIVAMLAYSSGNYFEFMFIPDEHKSATWPSNAFSDIAEKTGITVPSFESSDIKTYYYYTKGDVVTVYAEIAKNLMNFKRRMTTYSKA